MAGRSNGDPGLVAKSVKGEGRAIPVPRKAVDPVTTLHRFLDAPYNGVYQYIGSVHAQTASRHGGRTGSTRNSRGSSRAAPSHGTETLQRSRSLLDPARSGNASLRPRLSSMSHQRRPIDLTYDNPDAVRGQYQQRNALTMRQAAEEKRQAEQSGRQLRDPMILPIDERFDLAPNPATPARVPGLTEKLPKLEDLLPRLEIEKLPDAKRPAPDVPTAYTIEYERLDTNGHVVKPTIREVVVPTVVQAKKDAFLMTPAERREVVEFEKRQRGAEKLIRAENNRVNRLRTLLLQRYPTGLAGYDGPMAPETETYRELATKIQRDRAAREHVRQTRQAVGGTLAKGQGVAAAVDPSRQWQEPEYRFSKRGCEKRHHTKVDLKNMMQEPKEAPPMHPALQRRFDQILEGQCQGRDFDIVTGAQKEYIKVKEHPQRFIHPSLMIV